MGKISYKSSLGLITELVAIIYFLVLGCVIIRWRAKSIKGDLDILIFDGKELVAVEVKGVTSNKQPWELLKDKQLKALRKKLRSVVLSCSLYPEYVRLDLFVIKWEVLPKIEWIQGFEKVNIFPI